MNTIRLLLVDHHPLLRHALRSYLQGSTTAEVVGEVGDAEELARSNGSPEIVCVSRQFPPEGGVACLPSLRKRYPNAKMLMLSETSDPAVCRSALLAGYDGYLPWECTPAEFDSALKTMREGGKYLPVALKAKVDILAKPPRREARTPLQSLSNRERQVLLLLARGNSYKQIAEKLDLGVKSIETYRARLFKKLGFENKADLMRFALDNGLLSQALDM